MSGALAAETDAEVPALYVPDGERLVPTIATRGPWSLDAQHGGPVAALVCRAAEAVDPPYGDEQRPMAVVRLTVELMRPVPLTPLSVRTSLRRSGRRVQLVEVLVLDGEQEVALGTVLRLRIANVPVDGAVPAPGTAPDGVPAPPPPSDDVPSFRDDRFEWLDTIGIDVRFVSGGFYVPGPAAAWFRLRVPIVAGEEPTPAQRVAAAADSGSGVGAALTFGQHTFLNPELTVHLAREPQGEWVGVQAGTMLDTRGSGVTTSRLWDLGGVIGQASQALLVQQV
jgi:hypothetical protein